MVNDAFANILGYTPQELLSGKVKDYAGKGGITVMSLGEMK